MQYLNIPNPHLYRMGIILIVSIIFISGISLAENTYEPVNERQSLEKLTFYTEHLPPYNYEENGSVKGLSIDLLEAITLRMGHQIPRKNVQIVPWETGYQSALTENNSVIFSTGRIPSRESLFRWAGPISVERDVLFANADAALTITTLGDVKGLRVGVTPGHAGTQVLLDAGVSEDQIVTDANVSELIRKLQADEIDLWCYPELTGRHYAEKETGNYYAFKVVFPLEDMGIYYAFSRDVPESTVQVFQNVLDTLKEEKDETGITTYERILERYIPAVGLSHLQYLTEEWAPYNYLEDGIPAGISVDILEKVFKSIGVNKTREDIRIVPLSEGFRQAQEENGTVLFSIAKSPEREPLYQWAGPFTTGKFVLFAPEQKNISITNPQDLAGYRIGTVQGTIENTLLTNIGAEKEQIETGLVPGDLIRMLEEEQIDLWATGDETGKYEMKKEGLDPQKYEAVYTLSEDDFYFIFSKDVPDSLVQAFNQTLMSIRTQ
ncbi:substrate-binding periplasmic protein [Methanospirillum stamsii]|uniref:ABC transporter substrate-binding protein n=1 Tax=Methanospirillum stamsii TaxID=1277351 RepID=A0A2V2N2B6_9EURY|nr:transporter substrate-binding domain-containing protein [Methanospirillum stamsii]PWR71856.1 ABC transporter substrate-binding protein [Methanospirillum stamsii]